MKLAKKMVNDQKNGKVAKTDRVNEENSKYMHEIFFLSGLEFIENTEFRFL